MADKLIDECNENIEETSLVKINSTNCKHNSCILHIVYFQYSLQLMLELLLILFTVNTEIIIAKMFLNIMVTSITQKVINMKSEK